MNVRGFPQYNAHPKSIELHKLINDLKEDVVGHRETNMNWSNIPAEHRLGEWTLTWWESKHIATAYNMKNKNGYHHQWGGVSLNSTNKRANWAFKSGRDPTNLERWVWARYKGRNRIITQVRVAYPLCRCSKTGDLTVYAQRCKYFQ